jgi:hypothetical protein
VESLHFDKVVDFYHDKEENHLKKFRELRKKTQKKHGRRQKKWHKQTISIIFFKKI